MSTFHWQISGTFLGVQRILRKIRPSCVPCLINEAQPNEISSVQFVPFLHSVGACNYVYLRLLDTWLAITEIQADARNADRYAARAHNMYILS
jgi:hypothetical protein